jgi:beta-lactamase class A
MKLLKITLFIGFSLCFFKVSAQKEKLRAAIQQVIKGKDAEVGVGVLWLNSGDTLTINGNKHYPTQSVYKFHLALAVLNQVDKGKLKLDQKVLITKEDVSYETWSPIREKYPNGNVELPLSEIIKSTVSQSDNVGCDVQFRLMGGPQNVNKYIQSFKIKDMLISTNEYTMQSEWEKQFTNYSSPLAAVRLLEKFYKGNILSKSSYDFLWKTMVETTTGPNKIKGLIDKNIVVAHKTGLSSTKDGLRAANNDIGILILPNGEKIALSVFVANSRQNTEYGERIIAEIAKVVVEAKAP